MPEDIRDPADRYVLVQYRDLVSDWTRPDLDFRDDRLLATLFEISEWVLIFSGPILWFSLIYLFLVAELSR
jgi:hypothetical protein